MPLDRTQQSSRSPLWFIAALFAGLVIVGLLSMHTIATAHAGVPGHASSTGITAPHPDHLHDSSLPMGDDAATACESCNENGPHHAMVMACVLGLLVTLLLVHRPAALLIRERGPSVLIQFLHALGTLLPRPPSLIVLSISRT
ncbi:DUF6153 family protein [Microbacterium sp. SLBN-146]|uniref:DUF6153 family protein n=1 Tax=Microbacterium sp. SLBN-146 TaxID=2768457 RepID=UPI001151956F|nr:DUF6153 family protein [Microbacterium sp. SLBN-146]